MSTHLDRRSLGDDSLESALRDAFRHGAEAAPRTPDPLQRTTTAVRRSQVRHRAALTGAAATVALTGLVVGIGGPSWLHADRPTVAHRDESVTPVRSDDVTTWPVRGDLANDAAAVGTVSGELAKPGRLVRLLYAGHVAGRVTGVGVLELPDDTTDSGAPKRVLAAVLAPTPLDDTWSVVGYPAPGEGVVSLAVQREDYSIDLLVLARTDARQVAVSRAPVYDDRAVPSRTFDRLDAVDGVATTHLPPGPVAAISVLADRSPATSAPGPVLLARTAGAPEMTLTGSASSDPRCTGRTDSTDVLNAVENVRNNRELTNQAPGVQAAWCRDVSGGRVALFAVTLSDGRSYLAPIEIATSGAVTASTTTVGIPVPTGAELTTPVVLPDLPVAATGQSATTASRWFVHAPGARTVEVVGGDGAGTIVATVRPDADGFAQVSLPSADAQRVLALANPRVVLRDASGRLMSQLPLVPDLDERTLLAQTLPGPVS